MAEPSGRTILHVDMDAFFASVEALDNPALRGKPVIVGSPPEKHGVVAACSYEARKFGVHSAMPMAQAVKLCPHAAFIHPHHGRYAEMSEKVMFILRGYSPLVEQVSVDEAYLDVTGCGALFGEPERMARDIKGKVLRETGLTCSIGVAPNKFLAKLGSDLDKPDGLTVMLGGAGPGMIAPLPIEKMHGVGPATAKRLRAIGIRTIGDLARYPDGRLSAALGEGARDFQALARGEDDSPVLTGGDAKSVSREETFEVFLRDPDAIRSALQELADDVAGQLRADGIRGRTVQIKVRDEKFVTVTRSMTLPDPVDTGDALFQAGMKLFREKVDLGDRAVRLLGIGASGLERDSASQMQLFADGGNEKKRKVATALDRIRERHGDDSVVRGSAFRKTGRKPGDAPVR